MPPIPDRDYHRLMAQIQYQQRYIAALEADNHELQRRLSDLRRGIGISVTVQGQTMSLTSPVITVVSQASEPVDPGITGIFPSMDAPTGTSYTTNQSSPPHAPPKTPPTSYAPPPPEVTPPWLRDQPPVRPTPRASYPAAGSVGRAASPGAGRSPHSPAPDHYSTLAKLTGHHPAAHQSGEQRQHPGGSGAYSDSFVLG